MSDSEARVLAPTDMDDAAAGGIDGAVTTPPPEPTCPVCMEPWNCTGDHRICCIPCGHVYGRSCLERWLQRNGNDSAKCPQCGEQFEHNLIINLYAPGNLWDGCCRLQEAKAHFQSNIREAAARTLAMVVEEKARSDTRIDELIAKWEEKDASVGAEIEKMLAEYADNRRVETELFRADVIDQVQRMWNDQEATARADLMTMKERMRKMAEVEQAKAADLIEFMELSYPRLSLFSNPRASASASAPAVAPVDAQNNTRRSWNRPDQLPPVPTLPGPADAVKKRRRRGT